LIKKGIENNEAGLLGLTTLDGKSTTVLLLGNINAANCIVVPCDVTSQYPAQLISFHVDKMCTIHPTSNTHWTTEKLKKVLWINQIIPVINYFLN